MNMGHALGVKVALTSSAGELITNHLVRNKQKKKKINLIYHEVSVQSLCEVLMKY